MSPLAVPESARDTGRAARDRALFTRLRDPRDPTDREAVVERFLPLARSVSRNYAYSEDTLDDVFQVACVGLVKAVDRFDVDRHIAFTSYAVPTMSGEIKRYYRDRTWLVRPPRALHETALRVERAAAAWHSRHGSPPTVSDLAEVLDATDEEILEAMQAGQARTGTSLDMPTAERGGEAGTPLVELIGDVDDGYAAVEDRMSVDRLLCHLPERDRDVLRMRFEHGMTQAEIGDALGLSQMQISRIIRAALDRVRAVAEVARREGS